MRLGRLKLERIIGRGGAATVWLAEHEALRGSVAVKFLRPEFCDSVGSRASFLTEAKTIASLHHPNIVKLYDYGIVNDSLANDDGESIQPGTPFYVMDYYPHGTLKEALGQVEWDTCKSYLLAVLDGLATAHAHGLVHRDLKPANILLGDDGPVISDFGIAYRMGEQDSQPADFVIGTPLYMAPEQFRRQDSALGPWTDFYALGCMCYWLCTGLPPFSGHSMAELAVQHLRHQPEPMEASFPVPSGFIGWVAGCLAKSTVERPQLAADAAFSLSAVEGAMTVPVPIRFSDGVGDLSDYETMLLPAGDLWAGLQTKSLVLPSGRHLSFPNSWKHPKDEILTDASRTKGVGLLAVANAPLIGRVRERDVIWSSLLDSLKFGVRFVLIEGPSGIGKTALMEWIGVRASTFGVALPLRVSHSNTMDDLSGLSGLLRRELRLIGLSGEDLKARVDDVCQMLEMDDDVENLLTIVSPHLVGTSDTLHQNARFEVLARFLAKLCEHRPRILMVDDYQWDEETSGFLRHLASTRGSLPILVLVSRRHEDNRFSSFSAAEQMGLPDELIASHLTLDCFGKDEFKPFVHAHLMVTEPTLEHLFDMSGGHPLALKLALHAFAASGRLNYSQSGYYLDDSANNVLSEDARRRWLAPLLLRSDQYPDLVLSLEAAAVLGVEIELMEWLEVCDALGVSLPFGAIDVLIDEGFLAFDEFEHGHFVHRQCQELLVAQLAPSLKVDINRAVVAVIGKQTDAAPWRLAQHCFAAKDYERAIQLLPLAWELALKQDRFPMAKDVLLCWIRCFRQMGRRTQSREWLSVKLKWSQWLHLTGRTLNAIRHARVVATCVSEDDAVELHVQALLLWTLAAKWQLGAAQDNLLRIEKAKRLAELAGQPDLILECTERHAVYLHTYGDLEASREQFSKALMLVGQRLNVASESRIMLGVSRLLVDLGEIEDAKTYGALALGLGTQLPNRSSEASIRLTLGDIARRQGDYEDSARHYTKAAAIFERLGAPELWAAWANSGLLALDEGEWEDGGVWLSKALNLVKSTGNESWALMIESCLLRVSAQLGGWTRFDAVLERLLGQKDHDYAQKDSCDQLFELHHELLDMNEMARAMCVERLCTLQRAACGI